MEGSLRKPAPIDKTVIESSPTKIAPPIPIETPTKETPPPAPMPRKIESDNNCIQCKIISYSRMAFCVSTVFLIWAFIYKILKTANNG